MLGPLFYILWGGLGAASTSKLVLSLHPVVSTLQPEPQHLVQTRQSAYRSLNSYTLLGTITGLRALGLGLRVPNPKLLERGPFKH